jgi:hypothetical protein
VLAATPFITRDIVPCGTTAKRSAAEVMRVGAVDCDEVETFERAVEGVVVDTAVGIAVGTAVGVVVA